MYGEGNVFTHISHSVNGGGGVHPGVHPSGLHPGGVHPGGCIHLGCRWMHPSPPEVCNIALEVWAPSQKYALPRTQMVNKRAVRILLECIFVLLTLETAK